MPSIIIAAHNEAPVIGACLDAVLRQAPPGTEVIVVANGCSDGTAAAALRPGVTVIDLPRPGKTRALNAGDRAASSFPRIYLDADIVVPAGGLSTLLDAAASDAEHLAWVPGRVLETRGRPWPVRGYFAINERLPVFRTGLFGRGLIVLSEEGRARFDRFPDVVSDDLFLDSRFEDSEKGQVPGVTVTVRAPMTTRHLVARLVRVRKGNAELRAQRPDVRPGDRLAWLRDVVLPHPRLAFAAVPYVGVTVLAGLRARRAVPGTVSWGHDVSTRGAA